MTIIVTLICLQILHVCFSHCRLFGTQFLQSRAFATPNAAFSPPRPSFAGCSLLQSLPSPRPRHFAAYPGVRCSERCLPHRHFAAFPGVRCSKRCLTFTPRHFASFAAFDAPNDTFSAPRPTLRGCLLLQRLSFSPRCSLFSGI